jgi:replicative DNA helicase
MANGLELLVLHHQRKGQGDNKKPTAIDDVYGSTFITGGMGSVVLVWGQPGDLLVELTHLKQPAEPVGPWKLLHDHSAGITSLQGQVDLLALVRTSNGLTAEGAARTLYETDKPKPNEIEKARRQLEKFVARGLAHAEPGGRSALEGRQLPTRYYAVTEVR